jgi:hypothetical protein
VTEEEAYPWLTDEERQDFTGRFRKHLITLALTRKTLSLCAENASHPPTIGERTLAVNVECCVCLRPRGQPCGTDAVTGPQFCDVRVWQAVGAARFADARFILKAFREATKSDY